VLLNLVGGGAGGLQQEPYRGRATPRGGLCGK